VGTVFLVQAAAGEYFLRGGEEGGGFNGIGEDKVAEGADEDGEEALHNEDPAPAGETAFVADCVETAGEEATEGAGEGCSGVEDADAEGKLGAAVEVREVHNLEDVRGKGERKLGWGSVPCQGGDHLLRFRARRGRRRKSQSY